MLCPKPRLLSGSLLDPTLGAETSRGHNLPIISEQSIGEATLQHP